MARALTQQQKIFRNVDFILLNINALLIILGYGLAVYTDTASVPMVKLIKTAFLAVSLIALLKNLQFKSNPFPSPTIIYLLVFAFWVTLMAFFVEDVVFSIMRAMTFIFPLFYTYLVLSNLANKYDVYSLLKAFARSFNLIYSLPIIVFLLSGAGFSQANIYGQTGNSGHFFISNQYGWACAMFLITGMDVWLNTQPKKLYKYYLLGTSVVGLFLVMASGNRASWVAICLAIIIFTLRLKNIRSDFKLLIALIPIVGIIWFYQLPESSLQARLSDTETQIDKGEARFNTAKYAFGVFNEDKIKWITGAGMFNYEGTIGSDGLGDYHNSYLEVLFGGGIGLFIMFINFMIFRPFYYYIKYYSKTFLLITPVAIIPVFESNLTGGQFLFYPWFVFILLFNIPPEYDKKRWELIRSKKEKQQKLLVKPKFI
ncbi:MAG: O-antigen ligase family protein [Chitinophagales bacterium]